MFVQNHFPKHCFAFSENLEQGFEKSKKKQPLADLGTNINQGTENNFLIVRGCISKNFSSELISKSFSLNFSDMDVVEWKAGFVGFGPRN